MTSSNSLHVEPLAGATRIDRIAEAHFSRELELSPWKQLDVGIGGETAELDDYSPEGLGAYADLCRDTLSALDAAEAAAGHGHLSSAQDRITAHALRERLGIARELHATGLDGRDFNVIESAPQLIRDLFDMAPRATAQDWELNAGRLRNVHGALAGYARTVACAVEAGAAPAVAQVRAVMDQASTLAQRGGHFDRFAREAHTSTAVPTPLAAEVASAAHLARAAYADFAEFLSAAVLPRAQADPACGADAYALHSRFHLGDKIDARDAHDWALDDLGRIDAEQRRLVRRLGLSDTLHGTFAALDSSPEHSVTGHAALIDWMQRTADEAISVLSRDTFDIPAPLQTIECRVQPEGTGVVFYSRPTADFSRPGRMWWSVPAGVESFGTWQERTTVYHEGAPGHHLQYGIATCMSGELNAWRRQGCWVSGHGEGWALYAEQLMADLGFHEDPAHMLGMLDSQRLRTARVCIDTGVHCRLPAPESVGGGTWDSAKAWHFLSANVAMNEPSRRFEHLRYMGWPGQASSYRLGEKLWRQIREETRSRRARDFSQRAFHRSALEVGSVGLSTLRMAAERF